MLRNQLWTELRRSLTIQNSLMWLSIITVLPITTYIIVMKGYFFLEPVELFQEMVAMIIPLFFPVIIIMIYLPTFLQEQKYNFITYTRPRTPLNIYIISKGLVNAFLTGVIIFLMIIFSFSFAVYIEPNFLNMVDFSPAGFSSHQDYSATTFSQFLSYGTITYGFIYSLWVTINSVLYSTIAFLLMLILRIPFVALSAPFIIYHISNYIVGVFGVPQFSPLSTIFPFNIEQQPLWTVMVPFTFLTIFLITLYFVAVNHRTELRI